MTSTGDGAREVARRVLRRVETDEAFASLALSSEIERADLDVRDAALATELAMGVLRHRRRIDAALAARMKKGSKMSPKLRAIFRVGAFEILFVDGIPARASVNEAATAARALGGQKVAGFVNAVLRRLDADGEPDPSGDDIAAIGVRHSLPDWIVSRLRDELGADELDAAAAAMSSTPAVCLRANVKRISREELLERLAGEAPDAVIEVHPHTEAGLVARRLGSVARLASFRAGLFTVQDAGAQRVVELVSPGGVASALDACAGVGGKATHLAERLAADATIAAADISATKLLLLGESAERLGHGAIRAIECDLLGTLEPLAASYDVVVLDAPCSGLGVLRRHPETKWRLRPEQVSTLAALQERLLDALAPRVAVGGQLVYSVCTFTAEEGATQISSFLTRHAGFRLEAEDATWPHRHQADAFYAARLVRDPV